MSNEIAVKEEQQLMIPMADIAADAGLGTEDIGADVALPYLSLLQALSPQVKRGDQQVEGAKEGMLYNSVSGEVYETVRVIPCAYQKRWNEWRKREDGVKNGFVAAHDTDQLMKEATRDEKGRNVLPNGNILQETAYHFCLLVRDNGEFSRVLLSMKSTQLKKSRKWNSVIIDKKIKVGGRLLPAPSFAFSYELGSEIETNSRNESYANFSLSDPQILTDRDLYVAAKAFYQEISKGAVIVAAPPADEEGSETPKDADMAF